LNGRLQERVFVYSGFSGNAPYVWEAIKRVTLALEGQLNNAFAVDVLPAAVVFAEGNTLGAFMLIARLSKRTMRQEGPMIYSERWQILCFGASF